MASVIPDARLVYLVRDPIERLDLLLSLRTLGRGKDHGGSTSVLADLDEQPRSSRPAAMRSSLSSICRLLPAQQICVVDSADLRARPAETMARLFRFLGVDDTFASDAFGQRTLRDRGSLRGERCSVGQPDRSAYRRSAVIGLERLRSRIPESAPAAPARSAEIPARDARPRASEPGSRASLGRMPSASESSPASDSRAGPCDRSDGRCIIGTCSRT